MNIKIKKLHKDARVPKIATDGSACFDLYTCEKFSITAGSCIKARTGLAMEIPSGYFLQIVPRSGIAARGIIIPNSPAVIDSDYRGEIIVVLYGLYCNLEVFGVGSRVAQARLVKIEPIEFSEASELSETKRGSGGFGSSGG